MKNVSKHTFQFLFLALSLFLVQRDAFGQTKAHTNIKSDHDAPSYVKPNNIEIYPASLLAGALLGGFALEVGYERLVTPKTSIELKPSIASLSLSKSVGGSKYEVFAIGLRANYLFYLSKNKEKHTGWYVGPGVDISFVKGSSSSFDPISGRSFDPISGLVFGLNAIAGYQWIFRSGWVIDLGVGASMSFTNMSAGGAKVDYGQGLLPILKIGVGYNL